MYGFDIWEAIANERFVQIRSLIKRLELEPKSLYRAAREGGDAYEWSQDSNILAAMVDEIRAVRIMLSSKNGEGYEQYPRPEMYQKHAQSLRGVAEAFVDFQG